MEILITYPDKLSIKYDTKIKAYSNKQGLKKYAMLSILPKKKKNYGHPSVSMGYLFQNAL